MFLRSLTIENTSGIIRTIQFHAGLNLIVDETSPNELLSTGNNVGKTTVLRLIDFCLGGDPKPVFTDPENLKSEYAEIKRFLIDTNVQITLVLCKSLEDKSEGDMVIQRNFRQRKEMVRRINGQHFNSEHAFEEYLTNDLFPGHYGKKPTFPQIISHNIRYKEPSVSNTLKTLHGFTRPDEYEALYLFLFGFDFDQGSEKQDLLTQLRTEIAFKQRLEAKQTKSAYEISLSLLLDEINELEVRRSAFKSSAKLDLKIQVLGDVKYKKSSIAAALSRHRLRRDLVSEAIRDLRAQKSEVDVAELRKLYEEVSGHIGKLTKSFDDLVVFHNRMVYEKVRYIAKDLPQLEEQILGMESDIRALTVTENQFSTEIAESGIIEDMERIVLLLNDRHRRRGEFETIIEQITAVEVSIAQVRESLAELDIALFSAPSTERIQAHLTKFNRHFAAISEELYGERYALKADKIKTRTGQQIYEFSCFNTNFSSGKKQGEITCFDIAYTLFADEQEIPCYHFLLNDKKELMHDNQLERIGNLVERKYRNVQFVASILRDKLPLALNKDEYIVVKLSQADKLFRMETNGIPPIPPEVSDSEIEQG